MVIKPLIRIKQLSKIDEWLYALKMGSITVFTALALASPAFAVAKGKSVSAAAAPEEGLICGKIGKQRLKISPGRVAGAIYDQAGFIATKPCHSTIIVAGIYLDEEGVPLESIPEKDNESVLFLTISDSEHRHLLSARPTLDEDILSRQLAKAEGKRTPLSLTDSEGKSLNMGKFAQRDYYLHDDYRGRRVPYLECRKTHRLDDNYSVCEYIFDDESLGLAYRIHFNPLTSLDYQRVLRLADSYMGQILEKNPY